MKQYFTPALVLAYLIFLSFIQVSVAHSIIFCSLVGLYAFQEFLTRPEKINYTQRLEQLQKSFEELMAKNKEEVNAKFTAVEGEMSKVALQLIRSSSSQQPAKKPADDKKILF